MTMQAQNTPFGFIQGQARGDFSWFDGHQWRRTQEGVTSAITARTPRADIDGSTALAATGLTTSSVLAQYIEGSSTAPATDKNTATVMISRTSAMNGAGDSNAALWVNHYNSGSTQPVGISVYAENAGSGDSCGVYVRSYATGSANSYSYFGIGVIDPSASHTFVSNMCVDNATGADQSYAATGLATAAYSCQSIFDQAHKAGTGYLVLQTSAGGGNWFKFDVGMGFQQDTITTATIRDDSSSTTAIDINGSHTTAIDLAGATLTNAIVLPSGVELATGGAKARYLWVTGGDFSANTGTPDLAARGASGRYTGWALDAAATEGMSTQVIMPNDAVASGTVTISIYWSNNGAGAGDVRWSSLIDKDADGDNIETATGNSTTSQTITAPAQDVLKISTLSPSINASAGELVIIEVFRVGGDAADTLANDATLIGVRLNYTANF